MARQRTRGERGAKQIPQIRPAGLRTPTLPQQEGDSEGGEAGEADAGPGDSLGSRMQKHSVSASIHQATTWIQRSNKPEGFKQVMLKRRRFRFYKDVSD